MVVSARHRTSKDLSDNACHSLERVRREYVQAGTTAVKGARRSERDFPVRLGLPSTYRLPAGTGCCSCSGIELLFKKVEHWTLVLMMRSKQVGLLDCLRVWRIQERDPSKRIERDRTRNARR